LLKILADKNIYKLQKFLPEDVSLTLFDPENPLPDTEGFQILLVRTVTKLNSKTFPNISNSLKVIGTASSGSDHIDAPYFQEKGVKIIDAKGCNANAVSEYVITSMLLWSIKRNKSLSNFKVGVIGAGATGSAVMNQLKKFDVQFESYDPPKELRDRDYKSAILDDILSCDILTFHVPLTICGANPTFHLFSDETLKNRKYELIINASRGGVIDEHSLIEGLSQQTIKDVVIDVWENEPNFNSDLTDLAFIATPHIAGYSEQAKLNASRLVIEKISKISGFEIAPYQNLYSLKNLDLADLNYSDYELLLRLNPLREYDADLREIASRPDKITLFRKLRVDRPYRFEYPYTKINKNSNDAGSVLEKLGVHC